jgi:hypothetical protein
MRGRRGSVHVPSPADWRTGGLVRKRTAALPNVDASRRLLSLPSFLSAVWARPCWTHGLRGGLSQAGGLPDSVQFSGVFAGTIAGRVRGVLVEF